jgi:hypothetical protein
MVSVDAGLPRVYRRSVAEWPPSVRAGIGGNDAALNEHVTARGHEFDVAAR